MVQKRPFVEEFSDVSSKHQKLEHGGQLVQFLEFPIQDVPHECYTPDLGKSCFSKSTTENHVKFESAKIIDSPTFTENDIDILSGNNSNSSWPSSCVSDEDGSPEGQDYSPVRPRMIIKQPEDAYSYLMQRPPQKLIPIGPDYQADIPEWCGHDVKNVSTCSDFAEASTCPQALESNLQSSIKTDIKFLEHCIIPMPEIGPASCEMEKVGSGRTDCCCEDPGSVQCVRQHVREARVNLRKSVGLERFLELGFGDMGETVAEKWSDEDEELFHNVVFSNPASLGKNFWHLLASVFPSRTSFEIISYYFNVFMLRKRAEQNRWTPTDIDSDNDEWEGDDESEEDEDTYQNQIYDEYDSYDQHKDVKNPNLDIRDQIDFRGFKGMTNVSEPWPMTSFNNSSTDSSPQCSEKTVGDEMGAYDFQEDSGTAVNAVAVPQVSQEKVEDGNHWVHDEFILDPCDAKVWDNGYPTFPSTKADFLPTYSMIEEVFGDEDWEQETRDDSNNST